jgi:hypothetical protein
LLKPNIGAGCSPFFSKSPLRSYQTVILGFTVDGQLENSLREPWAKAVENAERLHTALTHFFNLTTTATNPENLGTVGFNKTRLQR